MLHSISTIIGESVTIDRFNAKSMIQNVFLYVVVFSRTKIPEHKTAPRSCIQLREGGSLKCLMQVSKMLIIGVFTLLCVFLIFSEL